MNTGLWYDQSPADHARALRFYADRSDECAAHRHQDPRMASEAERYERQARRLRAMAILCDHSEADCAGAVDFLGMTNPGQSREAEDLAVAKVEAMGTV